MRYSRARLSLLALPWLAAMLLGSGAAQGAPVFIFDDFNDNALNLALWTPFSMGGGVASEAGQRLEIAIPAEPGRPVGVAGIRLRGTVVGDFAVSVFYELPAPLTTHDTAVAIAMQTPSATGFSVGRDTMDWMGGLANAYFGVFGNVDPNEFKVLTSDLSGQFRFTRVGDLMAAWYWGGLDWVLIHQATGFGTEPITLLALAAVVTGPDALSVALDDFQLEAQQLVPIPEPGTLWLIGAGLLGLAGCRRSLRSCRCG